MDRREHKPMNHNTLIGIIGEEIAAHYLELRGMRIIARNLDTSGGEIDIVLDDGGELVFCEVKTQGKPLLRSSRMCDHRAQAAADAEVGPRVPGREGHR